MEGIAGQPTFEGELSETGGAISGSMAQGPMNLAFALERATGEEVAVAFPEQPVPGEGVVGRWLGTLEAGPQTLRLVLTVELDASGAMDAKIDSLDQGVVLHVGLIELAENRLSLSLPIGASFEGSLNSDGSTVEGTWSQNGAELPLTLQRLAEL